MKKNVTQFLLEGHLVEGEMVACKEIGIINMILPGSLINLVCKEIHYNI